MANNKQKLLIDIEEFLNSQEKCMFITGTYQNKKHKMVITALNQLAPESHILFRSSTMQNLIDRELLGRFISKQPKIGETYKIGNNIYESDSFCNSSSWYKTSRKFDFALFYPIDSIARRGVDDIKSIDNMFINKEITKIFLISWTDFNYDYSIFSKYVDKEAIYDAEEEDLEYHNRVIEIINRKNKK